MKQGITFGNEYVKGFFISGCESHTRSIGFRPGTCSIIKPCKGFTQRPMICIARAIPVSTPFTCSENVQKFFPCKFCLSMLRFFPNNLRTNSH